MLVHPQAFWTPSWNLQFLYCPTAPTSETAIFWGRLAQSDRVILPRAKGCGAGEEGVGWGWAVWQTLIPPFTSEGGPIPLSEVTHALHLTLIKRF